MDLERAFDYDGWANREVIAQFRRNGAAGDPARRILAHIIGTQWLWLERMGGAKSSMAVWPELTVEQCAAELDPLREAWRALLRTADRAATIEYRNSKGEAWTSRVDDVLTHVLMHGAYHRGQIATLVRQEGGEPPYTDFIRAAREHLLPESR